ncbi:alpha,alpha-trehalose-phosphate synthase (UDP-forming) [Corynebacterium endometrii]|uniref:alpha,alpha-trehalose-phosphate synthase (ADP-forming) n=1 Tax=Corynebacterium endometrii TaxID=2488819 RepID=A0A4P7QJA2_9CORY|nr:trehalose-6-phosphate synthase [Corynebacterium endometrii]QCB29186.1 Trehalose-phosphate synthase [Corynebacterium endometrii]
MTGTTNTENTANNSFVVVANRLPVDLTIKPDGSLEWTASPGGLVTALTPVLAAHQGCWVGWPGVADEAPEPFRTEDGVLLHPVRLSDHDYEAFYEGFSNATLWPLYHDLIVTPVYEREWWDVYREVNLRFAEEVAAVAAEGATVWVQDYQLQMVPGILRQMRPDLTIGFFLHIPFPSADLFRQLPWREELTRGLMGADLIGFHLESNARNFLDLARELGLEVEGEAKIREVGAHINMSDGHRVGVAAFPISIDCSGLVNFTLEDLGRVEQIRSELGNPQRVILGVDRMDYTKGILQRLTALEEMLETGAVDAEDITFIQVATPSRERIDHYRATRAQVEEAVGRINGRFGRVGRPVVHYLHRGIPKDLLRIYYRLADVMLVTPFKDGMNLVAKEYVACHNDYSGALVLSEFAGAADELVDAHLCNPFDIENIKRTLWTALNGLDTDPEGMAERMKAMHEQVTTHDVDFWASSFLDSLGVKEQA